MSHLYLTGKLIQFAMLASRSKSNMSWKLLWQGRRRCGKVDPGVFSIVLLAFVRAGFCTMPSPLSNGAAGTWNSSIAIAVVSRFCFTVGLSLYGLSLRTLTCIPVTAAPMSLGPFR